MCASLMVPMKLRALRLEQDRMVVGPRADFSLLPYNDGAEDVNGDTANISENIIAQPLSDQTLNLKAGIHLHWELPEALTRGADSVEGTVFPAVPNRWLVVRSRPGDDPGPVAWVVESDYLHPEDATGLEGGICVPVTADPAGGHPRPYRFQG